MREISEAKSISRASIFGLCICLIIGVMILLAGVSYFSLSPGWHNMGGSVIILGLLIILYVNISGIVLWGGIFMGGGELWRKL